MGSGGSSSALYGAAAAVVPLPVCPIVSNTTLFPFDAGLFDMHQPLHCESITRELMIEETAGDNMLAVKKPFHDRHASYVMKERAEREWERRGGIGCTIG